MGKRKDRRRTALSNAGRRVKLDLFVEPSGELGSSSVHEEEQVDLNINHRAGLPDLLSSSGQQILNPLVLLEQYSDDEVEEESDGSPHHTVTGNSSAELDDQASELVVRVGEEVKIDMGEDHSSQKVEQPGLASNSAYVNTMQGDATVGHQLVEEIPLDQLSVSGSSEIQVVGDVSLGWKILMHATTNRYYYWNTETGETSWEVPKVLAEASELSTEQESSLLLDGKVDAIRTFHVSPMFSDDHLDSSVVVPAPNASKGPIHQPTEGDKVEQLHGCGGSDGGAVVPRIDLNLSCASHGTSSLASVFYHKHFAGNGQQSSTLAVSEGGIDKRADEEHETEIDLSSQVLEHGEKLMERLKSLKGSMGNLSKQDWMLKYSLEVEIRLSDIRSLLSHGASLFRFWQHSERQLRRLEDEVNIEVSQLASKIELESTLVSLHKNDDETPKSLVEKLEVNGNQSTAENCNISPYMNSQLQNLHHEAPDTKISPVNIHSVGFDANQSGTGAEEKGNLVEETSPIQVISCKSELQAGEEVDMDVDMEVEDSSAGLMGRSLVDAQISASEDGVNPCLPDEEWIPPPPPDHEMVPPPPPPPDTENFQPSLPMEAPESFVQSLTYLDQHNVSYNGYSYGYYGPVADMPNSGFYGHPEGYQGFQVAVPQPTLYYETSSSSYTSSDSVIVNSVEPVAYYDALSSEKVGYLNAIEKVSGCSLPSINVEDSAVCGNSEVVAADTSSALAMIQAPPRFSVDISAPIASVNITSASEMATSAAPKIQSKVLRSKKRMVAAVPSMRANKRVSSMVDKWKAAKEELHEDEEEEPEDPYEALEKKKQKKIEEWRAQQIASGEAKDNANFQPLGGDWRERVKRRSAHLSSEAVEIPAVRDKENIEKLPNDLTEYSRDLPSGWQAFWDESSKQIYYGNTLTSETTWIRPTK